MMDEGTEKERVFLSSIQKYLEKQGFLCLEEEETLKLLVSMPKDYQQRERVFVLKIQPFLFPPESALNEAILLEINTLFPFTYPLEVVHDVKSFLLFLNSEALFPGFGIEEGEGKVYFKYPLFLEKQQEEYPLLFSVLGSLILQIDLFLPALEEIVLGQITFEALIEKLLEEETFI